MKSTTVDLMALGPLTDIPTASKVLHISRSYGFELAKRGEFPCRVIKVGSRLHVVVASLRELIDADEPAAA